MAVVSYFSDTTRPQTSSAVSPPRYSGVIEESPLLFSPFSFSLLMVDHLILWSFPAFSFENYHIQQNNTC